MNISEAEMDRCELFYFQEQTFENVAVFKNEGLNYCYYCMKVPHLLASSD